MAIAQRKLRRSLLNSSINIRKIGESMTAFGKSIVRTSKTTSEIIDVTQDKAKFTNRLIRNDDRYFRKRVEARRRRNNEDIIEASTISGVVKRTGKIRTRSTKGFLGRIMDFFGILFLGWGLKYLPSIIKGANSLMKGMGKLVLILKDYLSGTFDILSGFGGALTSIGKSVLNMDFTNLSKDLGDNLSKVVDGFGDLYNAMVESFQAVANPMWWGLNIIKRSFWQFGRPDASDMDDGSNTGFNKGGLVKHSTPPVVKNKPKLSPIEPLKFNTGGSVKTKGTVGYDTVPAWLTSGEYVITQSVVNDLGTGFFDAINSMSYHPSIKDIDITEDQSSKYRDFEKRMSRKWAFEYDRFVDSVTNFISNMEQPTFNPEDIISKINAELDSNSDEFENIGLKINNMIKVINKDLSSIEFEPVSKTKQIFIPISDGQDSELPLPGVTGQHIGDVITKGINIMKILQDLKYA
mgnify:CR=1 FL=1